MKVLGLALAALLILGGSWTLSEVRANKAALADLEAQRESEAARVDALQQELQDVRAQAQESEEVARYEAARAAYEACKVAEEWDDEPRLASPCYRIQPGPPPDGWSPPSVSLQDRMTRDP